MRTIIGMLLARLTGKCREDDQRIGRLQPHVKVKEPFTRLNGQLILPGIGTPYEWK